MTESDLFLFLFVLKFDFKSLNCFAAIGIRIDLQPSNDDSYVLPSLNTKQPRHSIGQTLFSLIILLSKYTKIYCQLMDRYSMFT